MNINEYISSGILEAYVLGNLTLEEAKSVEKMAAQYPEVKSEIIAIEKAMERYASVHSKTPNANLKNKILSVIDENKEVKPDAKVISLEKKTKIAEYLAAASISIAIISAGISYHFYKKYKDTEDRLMAMQLENSVMSKRTDVVNYNMQKQLEQSNSMLSMLMDSSTAVVNLKGLAQAPSSKAKIFWNKSSKEVLLHIESLPNAPEEKQYQLWAMVNGKPVDAGVIDMSNDMIKMKNIENAQAFAVTLEKKGGSPTPTMQSMYLMGKI